MALDIPRLINKPLGDASINRARRARRRQLSRAGVYLDSDTGVQKEDAELIKEGVQKEDVELIKEGVQKEDAELIKEGVQKEDVELIKEGVQKEDAELIKEGVQKEDVELIKEGVQKEDVELIKEGVQKEDAELIKEGVQKEDVELIKEGVQKEDVELIKEGVQKEDVELIKEGVQKEDAELIKEGVQKEDVELIKEGVQKEKILPRKSQQLEILKYIFKDQMAAGGESTRLLTRTQISKKMHLDNNAIKVAIKRLLKKKLIEHVRICPGYRGGACYRVSEIAQKDLIASYPRLKSKKLRFRSMA